MSAYPDVCLLGARLNAFRLAYVTGYVWIGTGAGGWLGAGAPAGSVVIDSLRINDRLGEAPNTCLLTIRGARPVEGDTVTVALGSQGATPVFRGRILRVTRVWAADNPAHVLYACEATDPSWELGAVLDAARYTGRSASAIAADLVARVAAPLGFHGVIDPGLPVLDEVTWTNATVLEAFGQLARRIGGYTFVDYDKGIHLFVRADHVPAPRALTAAHPSLAGVTVRRDLTQVVTRAIVEGGGGTAGAPVAPGAGLVPVDPVTWYAGGGGWVRSGPQRIRYAGLILGGAGAFAGSGVMPTTAPTIALGVGASAVEAGVHDYAYTWVTASGESLPGPLASVTLGRGGVAPPAPAPGLTAVNATSGLVIGGTYEYAYCWNYAATVTDVDQLSKLSAIAAGVCQAWQQPSGTTAPSAAPGAQAQLGNPPVGSGITVRGVYGYSYTFVTAAGETTGSPGAAVTAGPIQGPTTAPAFHSTTGAGTGTKRPDLGWIPGNLSYYAFLYTNYPSRPQGSECSLFSAWSAPIVIPASTDPTQCGTTVLVITPDPTFPDARYAYLYMRTSGNGGASWSAPMYCGSWVNNTATSGPFGYAVQTTPVSNSDPIEGTLPRSVRVTLATGGSTVTARKVYRTGPGGSDFRLVVTIPDRTTTVWVDSADARGSEALPTLDGQTVPGKLAWANYAGVWDPLAHWLMVYRRVAGAWRRLVGLPVGAAWNKAYSDGTADATIAADPATYPAHPDPALGSLTTGQATIGGLAPGPAGAVTARKVYRTPAGGGPLKLLATVADNTATSIAGFDSTPDVALGVAAPTVDTAGVVASSKVILAGSTSLEVTSVAVFTDAGGWVLAGVQAIRYGGRSSTALAGIPATGDGSILNSIAYGTPVTVAPALAGIPATGPGAIVYPIRRGDPVNLVVIVDDAAAQADLAAQLGGGASGVREALLSDGRIGLTEAAARGAALLAQRRAAAETVAYRSRDPQTRAGALVQVDLPAPTDVHGSYRVQDVTVARFHGPGAVPPVYETTASADRFTFEDWVRQLTGKRGAPATGET